MSDPEQEQSPSAAAEEIQLGGTLDDFYRSLARRAEREGAPELAKLVSARVESNLGTLVPPGQPEAAVDSQGEPATEVRARDLVAEAVKNTAAGIIQGQQRIELIRPLADANTNPFDGSLAGEIQNLFSGGNPTEIGEPVSEQTPQGPHTIYELKSAVPGYRLFSTVTRTLDGSNVVVEHQQFSLLRA